MEVKLPVHSPLWKNPSIYWTTAARIFAMIFFEMGFRPPD